MKTEHTTLIVAASLVAVQAASAQTIDCTCSGAFEVGDRVILLVDDPSFGMNLPAGTKGTVLCGDARGPFGISLMVRWDGWTDGNANNTSFCDCPANIGGTNSDWFVRCTEIQLLPVHNSTQGTDHLTIAEGVAASSPGDVLELEDYTFFERDLVLDNRDITIRGKGPDLTFIDGGDLAPRIFDFVNGDESTIEGITIRNGLADSGNGGAAARILDSDTSVTFRDCHFLGNDSGGLSFGAVSVELGANVNASNCFFESNLTSGSGSTDFGVIGSQLTAVNCVFGESQNAPTSIYFQNADGPASGQFTNCTFAGTTTLHHILAQGAASVDVVGCAFATPSLDSLRPLNGATISASRNVYTGATGDNIDGVPTFIDAANGDFRLAPGSLGIDAADYDAYIAAGGGQTDLAGFFRLDDDAGTFNTGIGATDMLDCGAFEFQGNSPAQAQCPGDLDSDGDTDLGDFTILASDFGCVPTP
ncbi:MAG: hypothetical protein AAFX05_02905 [Planctomycetota bacterium]